MNIYQVIKTIEDISNLQFEIDSELMENGGEITPELEEKQLFIDGALNAIVNEGADNVINSVTTLDGKMETLKEMKNNVVAAITSLTKLTDRFKCNAGALLAVQNVETIRGELGSVKSSALRTTFSRTVT